MIDSAFKSTCNQILLFVAIALLSGCGSFHETVRNDLDTLKKDNEQIKTQLAEIQKLLKQRPGPKQRTAFKP